jgi:ABC-2 type transport system ATP-binding protein
VWDIVNGFKQAGRTVLLTTHYMEEAEKLCDRVAVVDRGKIIALGTPAELIAQLGGNEVIEFATTPALSRDTVAALPGVCGVSEAQGLWRITVQSLRETLPALVGAVGAAGAHLTSLATHRATLEDVFVSLTGRKLRDA